MVEVLKDHSVDYRTLKYHKCSFEEKTVTGMCLLLWQIYSTKRKIAIPGHGSRQHDQSKELHIYQQPLNRYVNGN